MLGYAAAVLNSRCTARISGVTTWGAAFFHSTAAALSSKSRGGRSQQSSKPHFRFSVREKRSDTKDAVKKLLFGDKFSDQFSQSNRQKQQKAAAKSNRHSGSGKEQKNTSKRSQNWRSFDGGDYPDNSFSSFDVNRSFTWYWPGENDHLGSSPFGFEWRDNSQRTKTKKRIWSDSDIDEEEEEETSHIDLQNHRIVLGLSPTGSLKLEDIKSAFRVSALKWHPDKHQGRPSQVVAEEKFKLCVDAYNSLAGALKTE